MAGNRPRRRSAKIMTAGELAERQRKFLERVGVPERRIGTLTQGQRIDLFLIGKRMRGEGKRPLEIADEIARRIRELPKGLTIGEVNRERIWVAKFRSAQNLIEVQGLSVSEASKRLNLSQIDIKRLRGLYEEW